MRTCWITLGRYGDILNNLPLVYDDFRAGHEVAMVCSRPYIDLLDAVSYCTPVPFDGDYSGPLSAASWIQGLNRYDQINVCQCHGTTHEFMCESFCQEMWRLVGRLDQWGKIPLVLDNRDRAREAQLVNGFKNAAKPILLVSCAGKSSPFSHKEELFSILESARTRYEIIDLDLVKAERFYDLLGFYDIASCLIAVDSGPLHLAQAAPHLPVISLIADSPTLWHGASPRPNHVMRIRYSEFQRRKGEIVQMLDNSDERQPGKIVHVYSDYERRDMGAIKRFSIARSTWNREYAGGAWKQCVLHESKMARNATAIGENKPVPFIKDLVNEAASICRSQDIICLTNDDTCMAHGLTTTLVNAVPKCGAIWSSRREHQKVQKPLTNEELARGYKHCGADLFVFTKAWWLKHQHEFPDFLISFEMWDLIMKRLMSMHGGRELENTCYHEIHSPFWHAAENRECAGNLYNRELGRKWLAEHHIPWDKAFI